MKDWDRHNAVAEFVRNCRKEYKMTQFELSDWCWITLCARFRTRETKFNDCKNKSSSTVFWT